MSTKLIDIFIFYTFIFVISTMKPVTFIVNINYQLNGVIC